MTPTPVTKRAKPSLAWLCTSGWSAGDAHEAVYTWIESNGYRITGPDRELNLYHTMPITQDNPNYVTEIQYPVEKMN